MSGTRMVTCHCGAMYAEGSSHTCRPGRPGPVQVTTKGGRR